LQELSFEVIPAHYTLPELSIELEDPPGHIARLDRSAIFSALGNNTEVKTLSVDVHNSMGESQCTAIKDGLGTNATLQHLKLNHVCTYDKTAAL
jgi:hypothetical protein